MTPANLEAARTAVQARDWSTAYDLYTRDELSASLSAQDLEGAGEAAFWTSHIQEATKLRERSFALYNQVDDYSTTARVALQVAWGYGMIGSYAVANGWFAKAQRILRDREECSEHGVLENALAHIDIPQGHLDVALARAREAFAIGERLGDADLQAAALNTQGSVLIRLGEVAEGMAAIDESMASAIAGELAPFTTAAIYCTTISACQRIGDVRRATEWIDAAEHCAEQTGMQDFPGDCRAHRVSILHMNGHWEAAEEAAKVAISAEGAEPSHVATVHQEVGEMRLYRGQMDAAADSFRLAEELGRNPQPGRALMCLAQGEVDAAQSFISTAVKEQTWDRLARARLLPALVEIALASGNIEDARQAVDELREVAETYRTIVLEAQAQLADGLLSIAASEPELAVGKLRTAMQRWLDLPAPFDAARSRLALSEALRDSGSIDDALSESGAAQAAFDRLGAQPYSERAGRLIEALHRVKSARAGESARVTRTFLFTDIVGSTNLLGAIGDEAWGNLVRWHDQALRTQFAAHDGEEIDNAGDGFFVAFESADAALKCATAIQRDLATHRKDHGFSPSVRIGVHLAEANNDGDGYSGLGVHHAARIGSEAQGNEILVSQETVGVAEQSWALDNPREAMLKGIPQPVRVVSLRW